MQLKHATKVYVHTDTTALVVLLNQLYAQQEHLRVDLEQDQQAIALTVSRDITVETQQQA